MLFLFEPSHLCVIMKCVLIIFGVCLLAVTAKNLPAFIEKCSKTGDKSALSDCIVRSTKNALPHIVQGDADLYIPDLRTLNPDDQVININDNLKISLKHIKAVSGALTPVHASMDFEQNTIIVGFKLPILVWTADFETVGKFKDLEERGKINITFELLQLNYKRKLAPKEINGVKHLQIESELTTGSAKTIEITPLEHQEHPDHDDEILNELFEAMKTPLEERLKLICGGLVTHIMNAYLSTVPEDQVFLA